MDMFGENYRGLHALKLLQGSKGWTLEGLQADAFDSYQPGFAVLIPALVTAWDEAPESERKHALAGPIAVLRSWDYRWNGQSVAQSLAMYWVDFMMKALAGSASEPINRKTLRLARDTSAEQKLQALSNAIARLTSDFGQWNVPWGEINRFQRISPAIDHPFSDHAPSIALPFASGRWGSLASVGSDPKPGTKRWYGTSGNSFVAVVEFGPRVRAKAVSAGGESGDPSSSHFNDQAARFAAGDLRSVYFYPDELQGHVERTYRPGE